VEWSGLEVKEEDSMNGTRNASSSSRHSTRAVGTCLTVLALWAIRGGLGVPLGPAVALDLNGRYVFLKQDGTPLPPRQWNADYWSTTAGLAFKF